MTDDDLNLWLNKLKPFARLMISRGQSKSRFDADARVLITKTDPANLERILLASDRAWNVAKEESNRMK